jgi:hypothetical protein
MDTKKYRVRLMRPIFQIAVVEVEANCEDDAILEAIIQADTVPEQAWSGEFDPESYFYDAHSIEEVSEAEDDYISDGIEDDCIPEVIEDDRKYLLLRGDIDSGTGAVPFQPWMTEISDLMVADLCQDWCADLADLEEAGMAGFYAALERQIKARDNVLAKVIPFRRPAGIGTKDEPV